MTRWFAVLIVLVVLAFAGSAYVYWFEFDRLPRQLPRHWNRNGEPDAWTAKDHVFSVFFALPAVMLALLVMAVLLPWMSPVRFKIDQFRDSWDLMMALVAGMLGYIHAISLMTGLSGKGATGHDRWIVGGVCGFFGLMGPLMPRLRPNFWMGVRTPWTIASETVWRGTHRLAAWLFTLGGAAGVALAIIGAPLFWCFVGLLAAALLPAAYSLVLYKRLERAGRLDRA